MLSTATVVGFAVTLVVLIAVVIVCVQQLGRVGGATKESGSPEAGAADSDPAGEAG